MAQGENQSDIVQLLFKFGRMLRTVFVIIVLCLCGQAAVAQVVSTSSFKIEINPDCVGTEDKKAMKYLEEARDRKNDKEERMEAARKCIEEDPNCAEAHYYLGLELLRSAISRRTSYKPAADELLKTVELCPDFHFEPYYFLGAIYLGWGKYAEAVKFYENYYRLSSASVEPLDDQREAQIKLDYEFAKFFADAYANPVPFDPVRVANVCTPDDEFLPLIAPDNESMLLTRRYSIESEVKASLLAERVSYREQFVQARRMGELFDVGDPLPEPFNVNENYHYGGAAITIDNKELFLTICMPAPGGYMNCDIYTSRLEYGTDAETGLQGYHWTKLEPLGKEINTPDGWEAQPSISSDGNTLYFASAREGSKGIDLYYSTRNEHGAWQPAKRMSDIINTEGNDKTPFMHSDSRTLYFASDGHLGFGGLDVFLARQNPDGTWQKPVNLGHPINTEEDEQAFSVSTDGKRVYFSAKDKKKPESIDIWSFELHKAARPEQVLFVKGRLQAKDGEPAKGAVVELKTMKTKEVKRFDVDPNDGKYAAVIRIEPGEDVVLNAKGDNLAFQSKLIETVAPGDPTPRTDESQSVNAFQSVDLEVNPLKEGEAYKINDIYYKTNSAEISERSKAILDEFAAYLLEHPSIKLEIHGHTDNVGSDELNLALSTDRAFSVKQYLESRGVSADRIGYKGFGASRPAADNSTEEGRALNRRTEFLVISK